MDMQKLRERENARLLKYRWVNQEQGTINVPIQQGMELLMRQGLPVREGAK
jgi:hypothetical protein